MSYVEYYEQIASEKKISLREVLRDKALDILAYKNRVLYEPKAFIKPRVQFLYFHHCFNDEISHLERLIIELKKYHYFISYSQAVEKIRTKTVDKPYIVFSSDDGFKNNLNAVKIFNKYNISACFFINPFIIETEDYKSVKDFCRTRLNSPPIEFMNWDDIQYLIKKGHEIGSHSWEHRNLASISFEEAKSDLSKSYKILSEKIGYVNHFSWPYGRYFHFNKELLSEIFRIGFKSCASAVRGCHLNSMLIENEESLVLRRDNINFHWNIKHILYFISQNAILEKNTAKFY